MSQLDDLLQTLQERIDAEEQDDVRLGKETQQLCDQGARSLWSHRRSQLTIFLVLRQAKEDGQTQYLEPVSRIQITLMLEAEHFEDALTKLDALPDAMVEQPAFRLAKAYALYHLDRLDAALALLTPSVHGAAPSDYLIAQIVPFFCLHKGSRFLTFCLAVQTGALQRGHAALLDALSRSACNPLTGVDKRSETDWPARMMIYKATRWLRRRKPSTNP